MFHYTRTTLWKLSLLLADRKLEKVAVLVGTAAPGETKIHDVWSAENEDRDPANRFFISNCQLDRLERKAHARGYQLLGIVHSHPDAFPALPSVADVRNCRHAINAVYHPASRSLTWFNGKGELHQEWIRAPWALWSRGQSAAR